MKNKDNIRAKILNQPSYWVEGINSFLYTAIIEYMEINDMNRTDLATYLGLSKGRISQILNDGEINFSIEKVVQIALKVDKFPIFEFKDKTAYLRNSNSEKRDKKTSINYEKDKFFELYPRTNRKIKIISLHQNNEFNKQLTL